MTTAQVKKQLDAYLPLLTLSQQELLLNMAKNILYAEPSSKRISIKQYNKEIEEAEARIAKGQYKTHEQAVKELSKW
jgi:hypothetical protein